MTPDIPASPVPHPVSPAQPRPGIAITDYTRQQLQALGWQDGDPVPEEFGQRLALVRATLPGEARAKLLDVRQLPETVQHELREILRAAKQKRETRSADTHTEANLENLHPQVREAAKQAMKIQQQFEEPTVTFASVSPVLQAAASTSTTPPADASDRSPRNPAPEPTSTPSWSPTFTPPQPPPTADAAQDAAERVEPTADTGASPKLTHCPRCAWDLSAPFETPPTEADKCAFVASIFGIAPFQKQYMLMGGHLGFTFRELTPGETDLVTQQCGYDVHEGRIIGDGQFLAAVWQYRLCLSLRHVLKSGVVHVAVPSVTDHAAIGYRPEPGVPSTPLPALQQWVHTYALRTESLRRLASIHHQQFQRLVESLEAMVSEPSFWRGIELHL